MTDQRPYRMRAIPGDFAEICATTMTIDEIRVHYGTGTAVVNRWIAEIGGRERVRRGLLKVPAPSDFAHFATRETVGELQQRYSRSGRTVRRWLREVGATPLANPDGRYKAPEDFRDIAPTMTIAALRAHYGRCTAVIRRWYAEAGIAPRKAIRVAPPPRVVGNAERRFAPQTVHNRDMSHAGQAADHLRRFGPVYRCDASGRQDANGTHWNRGGRTILDDAGLFERATALGWNPLAWRMVA